MWLERLSERHGVGTAKGTSFARDYTRSLSLRVLDENVRALPMNAGLFSRVRAYLTDEANVGEWGVTDELDIPRVMKTRLWGLVRQHA